MSEFALRCDRCHHCLDHATAPMQVMAVFRKSPLLQVVSRHRQKVEHRCRSCGYINIFHPAEKISLTPEWRDISLKKRA
jgi:hypothetical protein